MCIRDRNQTIAKDDIVITSKQHNNDSGEYLCLYKNQVRIMLRYNTETSTVWKEKSFADNPDANVEHLDIIGKIVAIVSPSILSIEKVSR